MNITKQYKTAMGDAAPVSPPFHDIWSQTKNGRPHFERIAPEATLGMSHFFPSDLAGGGDGFSYFAYPNNEQLWQKYGP